jgi:ATP-dependent helicase/nuclease subunit B
MHGAVDRFSKKLKAKNIRWQDADDKLIEELLTQAMEESAQDIRGFLDDKRLAGAWERYKTELALCVKAIRWQLSGSGAQVWESELVFGKKEGLPAYTVALKDGAKAVITGCIDRADRLKTPSGDYIRVVDYKLSDKKPDYGEFAFGLQIQLITYLMVLIKYLKSEGQHSAPAGAYYFSFALPSLEEGEGEEEAYGSKRMQGYSADDVRLAKDFGNMDENRRIRSVYLKVNAQGDRFDSHSQNRVFSEEDFASLFDYTEILIKNALEGIYSGSAEAAPAVYRQKACEYCDYKRICRFDESYEGNELRKVAKKNRDELMETVREAAGHAHME